jgi:hypothetical protein
MYFAWKRKPLKNQSVNDVTIAAPTIAMASQSRFMGAPSFCEAV